MRTECELPAGFRNYVFIGLVTSSPGCTHPEVRAVRTQFWEQRGVQDAERAEPGQVEGDLACSGQLGRVQATAADPFDAHDHALLGIWAAHQRVTFEPVPFGELSLLGW
jgi:hypothetical protein